MENFDRPIRLTKVERAEQLRKNLETKIEIASRLIANYGMSNEMEKLNQTKSDLEKLQDALTRLNSLK